MEVPQKGLRTDEPRSPVEFLPSTRDKFPLGRLGRFAASICESSEAKTFIDEWPDKTKQWLGSGFSDAIEPSIGQWQKIALARLFYRDPRIWILDEPTSSIDADAEVKIFERLEALPKDRTVILISHRFSTVRHADKIIVLADGMIKESGTHDELVKLGGEYARLFALQAVGYK